MWRNQVRQGSFFLFSRRWLTNHLTRRKVEIRTLSCKTARMCMLAWSFAACISDKYLNHITGINNMARAFIYIPSFNCNQRRLWRYCANVQAGQMIPYSHMRYFSWTVPKFLAWAFILIPSFLVIRCSLMRLVPNVLEMSYKNLPGLILHPFFLAIGCSQSRLVPNCPELVKKFGLRLHPHIFFLGICCSQMRLVPSCLELAYKNWHQPSSTSLYFRDSLLAYAFSTKLSWTSL